MGFFKCLHSIFRSEEVALQPIPFHEKNSIVGDCVLVEKLQIDCGCLWRTYMIEIARFVSSFIFCAAVVLHGSSAWAADSAAEDGVDLLDERTMVQDGREWSTFDGTGVTVYVLDSGIDLGHRAFRFADVDLALDLGGDQTGEDCSGHGTAVASMIVGQTGVQRMGSAPGAKVRAIRLSSCAEQGTPNTNLGKATEALLWIEDNLELPAVINISLAWTVGTQLEHLVSDFEDAAERLHNRGAIIVVAAGNNDFNVDKMVLARRSFPVVVGGYLERNGLRTRMRVGSKISNYGETIDFWAPAESLVAKPNGLYDVDTGTSLAAPLTTGVIARFIEARYHGSLAGLPHGQWPAKVIGDLKERATIATVQDVPSGNRNTVLFGYEPEWLTPSFVHVPNSGYTARDESDGTLFKVTTRNGRVELYRVRGSLVHFWSYAPQDFRSDIGVIVLSDVHVANGEVHVGGVARRTGFLSYTPFRTIFTVDGVLKNTAFFGTSDSGILAVKVVGGGVYLPPSGHTQPLHRIYRVGSSGDVLETYSWSAPPGTVVHDMAPFMGGGTSGYILCGSVLDAYGSLDAFAAVMRRTGVNQVSVDMQTWGTSRDDVATFCQSEGARIAISGAWNDGQICFPGGMCMPVQHGFIAQVATSSGLPTLHWVATNSPPSDLVVNDWAGFAGLSARGAQLIKFYRDKIVWSEDIPPASAISLSNGVCNLVPEGGGQVQRIRLF